MNITIDKENKKIILHGPTHLSTIHQHIEDWWGAEGWTITPAIIKRTFKKSSENEIKTPTKKNKQ